MRPKFYWLFALVVMLCLPAGAATEIIITNITRAATVPAGSFALGTTGLVTRLIPVDTILETATNQSLSIGAAGTNQSLKIGAAGTNEAARVGATLIPNQNGNGTNTHFYSGLTSENYATNKQMLYQGQTITFTSPLGRGVGEVLVLDPTSRQLQLSYGIPGSQVTNGAGALAETAFDPNVLTNGFAAQANFSSNVVVGPGGAAFVGLNNLTNATGYGLADTNWVLNEISQLGAYVYFGGPTNTFQITEGGVGRTNVWTGSTGPFVNSATSSISGLVLNAYVRHVISTNTFTRIAEGPVSIVTYPWRTGGGGTVSGHYEFYAVDCVSNIMYELASTPVITISASVPTEVQTSMILTNGFTATNKCYVALAFKINSVGSGGPQIHWAHGGNYPAHLNFTRPLSSATINASQIVGTLATNNFDGTPTANFYVKNVGGIPTWAAGASGANSGTNVVTVINARDYGADVAASAAVNSAAINGAIQAATNTPSGMGGMVFIPRGVYACASTIYTYPGITIMGEGREATVLNFTSAIANCIEYLTNNASGIFDDSVVGAQGLHITNPAGTTNTGDGIHINAGSYFCSPHLVDVLVSARGRYGIYLENIINGMVDNCQVSYANSNGVVVEDTMNSFTFRNNYTFRNGGYGFYMAHGTYSSLLSCASDSNRGGGGYYFGPNAVGVTMLSCGAEYNTGNNYVLNDVDQFTAIGCVSDQGPGTSNAWWVIGGEGVDIKNGTFHAYPNTTFTSGNFTNDTSATTCTFYKSGIDLSSITTAMWASVYVDGGTPSVFSGYITNVSDVNDTITISLVVATGSVPASGVGNRSVKITAEAASPGYGVYATGSPDDLNLQYWYIEPDHGYGTINDLSKFNRVETRNSLSIGGATAINKSLTLYTVDQGGAGRVTNNITITRGVITGWTP